MVLTNYIPRISNLLSLAPYKDLYLSLPNSIHASLIYTSC